VRQPISEPEKRSADELMNYSLFTVSAVWGKPTTFSCT